MSKDDKAYVIALIFMSSGLIVGNAEMVKEDAWILYVVAWVISMIGFRLMYKWLLNEQKDKTSVATDDAIIDEVGKVMNKNDILTSKSSVEKGSYL